MTVTKKILLIAGICVALVVAAWVCLIVVFLVDMERGEKHQRQIREEQSSGKWDFGHQPALFAVAHAIVTSDQDAIRAAAKALPDLQAPGRYGMTLLYFAVTESWQRPELVESVKTLLSLGADPNYTNGKRNSFAMFNAVHGSADVLRVMLEAGGNPNARDELGHPMILMNWYLGYYQNQAKARMDLLLDRGADVNSAMPATRLLLPSQLCLDHSHCPVLAPATRSCVAVYPRDFRSRRVLCRSSRSLHSQATRLPLQLLAHAS